MKKLILFLCTVTLCLSLVEPVFSADYGDKVDSVQSASTQNLEIASNILSKFKDKTSTWIPALKKYAFILFGYFLVVEIIMFGIVNGFSIASGGKHMGQVFGEFALFVILPASFVYAVITYYDTWSAEILRWFLLTVAPAADPAISTVGEGNFFQAGLNLCYNMWENTSLLSPSSLGLIASGFAILIVYVLIALQIVLVKAEVFIVLSAGIIILGFGSFEKTRGYAINFLRYVLAVSIKLFVMQLMVGIAFSFVDDFADATTIEDSAIIIGASVILFALIRCIPDICSGIIHGQHTNSGHAILGAMQSMTAVVAAGASAAIAGAGMAIAMKDSKSAVGTLSQTASAAGLSGGAKAGFMAKEIGSAAVNSILGYSSNANKIGRFNSKLRESAMGAVMSQAQPTPQPNQQPAPQE